MQYIITFVFKSDEYVIDSQPDFILWHILSTYLPIHNNIFPTIVLLKNVFDFILLIVVSSVIAHNTYITKHPVDIKDIKELFNLTEKQMKAIKERIAVLA